MKLATIKRWLGRGSCALISATAMLLGTAGVFAPSAVAMPVVTTCSGTPEAPGVLAGEYNSNVSIEGVCKVNSGDATVFGDLEVGENSTLLAAYGHDQLTGSEESKLRVFGNVRVLTGATLVLGCDPASFACLDDPNHAEPTLSQTGEIDGNIVGHNALGIVVHNSSINGRVEQFGGGGGFTCEPMGTFAEFGSPVYSAYEDSLIRGPILIGGLESCWLGLARLKANGHVQIRNNQLADEDAIEILSNTIHGYLSCHGNSHVWDNADEIEGKLFPRIPEPNTVSGRRFGQCRRASPETQEAFEKGELGTGPF